VFLPYPLWRYLSFSNTYVFIISPHLGQISKHQSTVSGVGAGASVGAGVGVATVFT